MAGSGATRPGRLPRRLTAAPQERDPSVARSSDFSGRDRNLGDFVRAMSFKSSRRRSQGARLATSERAAGGVVRLPPPSSSQTRWPPPFRPRPGSRLPQPAFCLWSYSAWTFRSNGIVNVSRLSCLTSHRVFKVCLMLSREAALHPFSWVNNIPSSGYATFCLSVHRPMDVWVVSTFWPSRAAVNIGAQRPRPCGQVLGADPWEWQGSAVERSCLP